jgi:hypothetical protein
LYLTDIYWQNKQQLKSLLRNKIIYKSTSRISYLAFSIRVKIRIMWRVWGRREMCTGCWWVSLRERDHWGDQDVNGRIILRWTFRKLEGVVGTGWSWLSIGTGGGHLWVR